ncbi:protein of unknown function [Stigmatella erecta]|uniref:DUF4879 domain-containing protein n=2 Tax=Stigmatella erecta TaxID=83460 RepID=A0A1I0L6M2_9BACT|nr:protein of unknown function [Stigmatella erecta]
MILTLLAALNATAADGQQTSPEGTLSSVATLSRVLHLDASQLSKLPTREQLEGGPVKLAPAPPLSHLQVYAVGSSNQGWEYPSANTYATALDHGGPVLLVVILEIGYGYSRFAKMNGGQLPSSANYLDEALCWNAYGQLAYCSAGQTVAGWLRYYDVSGYESGSFTYQNTSTNSPWNTMYTQISIR